MSGRGARRVAAGVVLLGLPLAGTAPALAAGADGTVTVTVVRDVNSDGSHTPGLELGEPGLRVRLTDDAGATQDATTDAGGVAVVDPTAGPLSGGRYRVEVTIPATKSFLRPAPAGGPAPSLSPPVAFVDVRGGRKATVLTGVHDPADYCHATPGLATACTRQGAAATRDGRALVSWAADAGAGSGIATEATTAQIGATYGLAYQRDRDRLFAGALTKRLTGYGPAGPGGIYAIDRATRSVGTFATVPDAGQAAHDADLDRDSLAITNAVGKEGLGDLDLSADGRTLYAVGLRARTLYLYDTAGPTAAAPQRTVAIPDPGCPTGPADWRPYGLGQHDGAVYVGGVCSAEGSQRREDLRAYVLRLDGTAFSTVVAHALDHRRGTAPGDTYWRAWQPTYEPYNGADGAFDDPDVPKRGWFRQANRPQPILSDIVFDRDGSMVLGFRDRLGDQAGRDAPGPVGAADTARRTLDPALGGITRVCLTDGGYVWDGDALTCPGHPTADPRVREYYAGGGRPAGGLAFAPRFRGTLSTGSSGVRLFDNATGAGSADFPVDGVGVNGLGDLELLCEPPPTQVGGRVWFDRDRDGVPDPSEEPLAGATVTLVGPAGQETTSTDARGGYRFTVTPRTDYQLRFDVAAAEAPADGEKPTGPPPAPVKVTTGAAGANDLTHDAGYQLPAPAPAATTPPPSHRPVPAAADAGSPWILGGSAAGLAFLGLGATLFVTTRRRLRL
ncbi:SdrD B-like domain-containing protein [Longispora sp. K20-0274]|uniref:SdrD B-like domain-containing protein n=1 Tax=Longispora sp. K20-0274 TaxID=3088255 RepID=UPI00399ABBAB